MPPATASATEVTHGQSLHATQNILVATLSELCWTRSVFDKDVFTRSKMGKTRYHLIQKGKSADADKLLSWIEDSAMELIQQGRLEMLTLTISDADSNNPNKFCEAWYFRFASEGVEVGMGGDHDALGKAQLVGRTQNEVKKMATSLITTIVSLADALEPLPNEHNISMRLLFKEDPENPGEQPAHFVDAQEAGQGMMSYRKKPEVLDIGQSKTPFHTMTLKVKTVVDDDDRDVPQETYAEPHWEHETDEMWRQSDDEGEDDEEHLKFPCSQKRVGDAGGLDGATAMRVDDAPPQPSDAELPDHLIFSCHEWLAKQGANERITGLVLQMMLPCTPVQADLLINKMLGDGVIKTAPKKTFNFRTYCVAKPTAPSLSQQSNATICSATPDFVEPATFVARTTRNRAYPGPRSSPPGSRTSQDDAPLLAPPTSSKPRASSSKSSCSKSLAAACKSGVECLSEMFGATAIRDPSHRASSSFAISHDSAKAGTKPHPSFARARRVRYGPGSRPAPPVTASLGASGTTRKRAPEW